MGKTFEDLTWEELCDLICGKVEDDETEEVDSERDSTVVDRND